MANALPGSAAAAPADPALQPVTARLEKAQQADAAAAEARDKADTTWLTNEYELYSQKFQREDFGEDEPFDPQV